MQSPPRPPFNSDQFFFKCIESKKKKRFPEAKLNFNIFVKKLSALKVGTFFEKFEKKIL